MHDNRVMMHGLKIVYDDDFQHSETGFRQRLAKKRIISEEYLNYGNSDDSEFPVLSAFEKTEHKLPISQNTQDPFGIAYDFLNLAKNMNCYTYITTEDENS